MRQMSSVRPTRGKADNTSGSQKPLFNDWIPVCGFHPGPEPTPAPTTEAVDTSAVATFSVGAQWELWCPLARTDQTLGHHDASARAHVDRRVPPGDRPLGCFSNQNWQQSFGVEVVDTER